MDELVALSCYQKKVKTDEHKEWFQSKLKDSNCEIFIIQDVATEIGVIRFDVIDESCEISLYLIPGKEGRGYGYAALSKMLDEHNVLCKRYIAYIKFTNKVSQMLFEKAGFLLKSRDGEVFLYTKENNSRD